MFRIKGHQGTSSTFSFIIFVTINAKISFSVQESSRHNMIVEKTHVLNLPNLKQNKFKYHVSQKGTLRDKFKLPIYQNCNHIG